MKLFVLRRGESHPLGPFTPAEVTEMRIRWQLSDADHYRAEGATRWKLVGELAPGFRSKRSSKVIRYLSAAAILLAVLVPLGARFLHHPEPLQADETSLTAGVPLDDPEQILPADAAEQPAAPSLEVTPAGSPSAEPPVQAST